MFSCIELSGFRGFASYGLGNLSRVNLLVGKNSSGKTSVLEAVRILAANGNPAVLADIAYIRDGRQPGAGAKERGLTRRSRPRSIDVSSLFFGHGVSPGINIRLATDKASLTLHISHFTDDLAEKLHQFYGSYPDDDSQDVEIFSLEINGNFHGHVSSTSPISESGILLDFPWRRQSSYPEGQSQFISADSLQARDMRIMWDRAIVGGHEAAVINALQSLNQHINAIYFLSSDTPKSEIIVEIGGIERRVPLSSLGDGIRRFLALSLSLSDSKDSIILIDEIDTGLHWTVMEDLWRLVIHAARDKNIQVFATTHSYDCVKGLASLLEREPELAEDVSLQKLERRLDEAVAFRGEQIPIAIDHNIELR